MIYITKFHGDSLRHSNDVKVITTTIWWLQCWHFLLEGFMKNAVEVASGGIIYITSAMKIGTGLQATIMFSFKNMRGCNVGIIDL
jgi:hypothetical protein